MELFFYSFPSATVVFLFVVVFDLPKAAASQPETHERPALFKRLKTYQAAANILALRAQDHYVEVITEQGSELCLVRLNDAISEAAPTIGVQIHRSHWVAISAIKKLETKGSDKFVCMTDGTSLTISQSRIKELRDVLGQGV
jgi:DNA-binding LytR/AlgR family response regulator